MTFVVRATGVHRVFSEGGGRVVALKGVDLVVEARQITALVGPPGSGKSTMVRALGGLDQGWTGSISILGRELNGATAQELARLRRREVGLVLESNNLIDSLTVVENVSLPLELEGMPRRSARTEARRELERVGVVGLSDSWIDELPAADRQCVALARALVGGQRALVVADEPTGGLDAASGDRFMEALRRGAEAGKGILVATADPRRAGWADEVVFLRDGVAVDVSRTLQSPDGLLRQP